MKLTSTQYKGLTGILSLYGIKETQMSLVKRHGRIRVSIEGNDSWFEFFKRKSIKLSEKEKRWVKVEHYELTVANKKSEVPDWTGVIAEFEGWIAKIT